MSIALGLECLGAYLLGAVPFGLILTRLFTKRDVRQVGSGNIGATNVMRVAGKAAGVLTLVLDALKGALPAYLGLRALGVQGGALLGGAAFLGHVFPVYLRFRGGKGVATGLGVFAVLAPWAALAGIVTYAVVFGLTRISAVGSLSALVALGAAVAFSREPPVIVLYSAVASLVVLRHRGNLEQLLGRGRKG